MNRSTVKGGSFRSAALRLGVAAALASAVGGMAFCPAIADDHGHRGYDGRGGYDHRGYDHGYGYGRRGYGPYYAPYQVYAPPPVYYPPQPSPGVSLFFPVRIR